ncbi:MAG: helix-turn-helix domain-containing protein [bacterium]
MVLDLSNSEKRKLIIIGERIKTLRKNRTNLSYKKFAELINMNKNTYYRIERGEGDYTIIQLLRILSYYGISMEEFFTEL